MQKMLYTLHRLLFLQPEMPEFPAKDDLNLKKMAFHYDCQNQNVCHGIGHCLIRK